MQTFSRKLLFLAAIIVSFIYVQSASGNWYAGFERSPDANGITALISAPSAPLDLVETGVSGVSNWVSTYYYDQDGKDWIQAGWVYYHWYSVPKQYVEWCIDYVGDYSICERKDEFANQAWGTTVDYWVSKQTGSRWCSTTNGYQRYCVDNLHNNSVKVMAKSEVHVTSLNPLDTVFDEVRYKDPSDNIWKSFDSQRVEDRDFPYDIEIFSNSHFRTYRLTTHEVYLPLVIK